MRITTTLLSVAFMVSGPNLMAQARDLESRIQELEAALDHLQERIERLEQQQTPQPGEDEQQSGEGTESELAQAEGEIPPDAEQQQALEQWLRRIPDDPGGLLRRKFEYEYRRRQAERAAGNDPDNW